MKRLILITLAALLSVTPLFAKKSYKMHKITKADLERTEYPMPVDGADALILDQKIDVAVYATRSYNFDRSLTREPYLYILETTTRQIKILTSKGTEYAGISFEIPNTATDIKFHMPINQTLPQTPQWEISATRHTLENGKHVKYKIEDKDIRQTADGDITTVSLQIEDADCGDIIEYTYSRVIMMDVDSYRMLYDMKYNIPSLHTRYDIAIPTDYDNVYAANPISIVKCDAGPYMTKQFNANKLLEVFPVSNIQTDWNYPGHYKLWLGTLSGEFNVLSLEADNIQAMDPASDQATVEIQYTNPKPKSK